MDSTLSADPPMVGGILLSRGYQQRQGPFVNRPTVMIAAASLLYFLEMRCAAAAELFIDQIGGVGNFANVHQTDLFPGNEFFFIETSGLIGLGLSTRILQAGDLNVMLVRQIGQGNLVGSLEAQQVGSGNFASLIQINSEAYPVDGIALPGHNRLDLLQHGENNISYLSQRGTNNLMLGIQRGTNQHAEVAQGRWIPSNYNRAGYAQFGSGNNVHIWQD